MQATARTQWVTPTEAAEMIGCHYRTVTKYVRSGVFKAHRPLGFGRSKPVRIARRDIEAFIRKHQGK